MLHRWPPAAIGGLLLVATVTVVAGRSAHDHDVLARSLAPARDPAAVTALFRSADAHGFAAAFARLEQTALDSARGAELAHGLAHALGSYAFVVHGDLARAYDECDLRFNLGCYHGVVRTAVRALPSTAHARSVAEFCARVPEGPGAGPGSTCGHGFGHGIAMRPDVDPADALRHCDLLVPELRNGCANGALMTIGQHLGVPPESLAAICAGLTRDYAEECYRVLVVVEQQRGASWPQLGARCLAIPEDHRAGCFVSLGALAFDRTPWDLDAGRAACRSAAAGTAGVDDCLDGIERQACAARLRGHGCAYAPDPRSAP